jgi:tetratricopeptide (TPR) repeat protein
LRLGKWAEALTHFEAAARQRGAKPAVFHNMALALERLGREQEAQDALEQALARGGEEEPRVHLSLGVLALRRGEFAAADAHFMHARPFYGTRAPTAVWFHEASLAAALAGQLEKTIALLTEGTEAHPHAAALHNNLCVALMATGRTDAAIRAAERGLQEDPGLASLHRNLGDLYLEKEQPDKALESYLRAVRHHETLGPEVWARIGALREAAGERAEAIAAFDHAILLNPTHAEAHARLSALRAG